MQASSPRAGRPYVCLYCSTKTLRRGFSNGRRGGSVIAGDEFSTPSRYHIPIIPRIAGFSPKASFGTDRKNGLTAESQCWQPTHSPSSTRRRQTTNISQHRHYASATDATRLSSQQLATSQAIAKLRERIQIVQSEGSTVFSGSVVGVSLREALRDLPGQISPVTEEQKILEMLDNVYGGKQLSKLIHDLKVVGSSLKKGKPVIVQRKAKNPQVTTTEQLAAFISEAIHPGASVLTPMILPPATTATTATIPAMPATPATTPTTPATRPTVEVSRSRIILRQRIHKQLPLPVNSTDVVPPKSSPAKSDQVPSTESSVDRKHMSETGPAQTEGEASNIDMALKALKPVVSGQIDAQLLNIEPYEDGKMPVIPTLSHDLSRVLFNPGVYQLQDPRSRVYNFDPYLRDIMPVSEFKFEALTPYVTSSEDAKLRSLAIDLKKKYIGSSSSMTGVLTHFHFLISQGRDINTKTLSRGFADSSVTFTTYQRSPSALFLRYRDGVYAIDADKEYDSANILMSLGRSMEKLFTSPKEKFEEYRKSSESELSGEREFPPEGYHYCQLGDFLMRSQLDAYDPRLPGTGMFDLKTRAVVSIRMNTVQPEQGLGYQIKDLFGDWESYEREYYDMIRSAFLKYSLQVRMGRMDGIFVAYHNIERIFGFQYVSLPEMDQHLHGQRDRCLGDQEFKLSIALLNKILDRATAKFPERSLRFHFETRGVGSKGSSIFMYVFAEPVDEEDIQKIQTANKAEIEAIQQRIHNTPILEDSDDAITSVEAQSPTPLEAELESEPVTSEESTPSPIPESLEASSDPSSDASNDLFAYMKSQTEVPSSASPRPAEPKRDLLAFKVTISNAINFMTVDRPMALRPAEHWTLSYQLSEMSAVEGARMYGLCQKRRRDASVFAQDDDAAANYYLQRLARLARDGKRWRREQDRLDRERGHVVRLYDDDEPDTRKRNANGDGNETGNGNRNENGGANRIK